MEVENPTAHCDASTITTVKGFKAQAPAPIKIILLMLIVVSLAIDNHRKE
jgi:hypothetical protein